MSGFRKNRPLRPFTWLLLLGAVAFAAGCSTANTTGEGGTSTNHILPNGASVAGWTVPAGGSLHAIAATIDYVSNGALVSCTECHGADLSGGIAKVSCFDPGSASSCHHGTITPWFDFTPGATQQHGVSAKRAPGASSFFACQICHGNDFSGGVTGIACADCHVVPAPHPPAPWLSGTGVTHTNTDPQNAPVCALCHRDGRLSPIPPPSPPARARNSARVLQQHAVPRRGGPRGPVQRHDPLLDHLRDVYDKLRDLPRGHGDVAPLVRADLRDLPHGGVAAHGAQLHFMPCQPADRDHLSGDRRKARQAQRPGIRLRRLRNVPQRPEHREPGALRPRQRATGEERAARRPGRRGVRRHLQREDGGGRLQQYRPHLRQRELPRRKDRTQLADGNDHGE